MAKHPGGRPVSVWTPAARAKLLEDFYEYLYAKDDDDGYVNTVPSVSEFCFQRHINRQRLYEFDEFSDALEACKSKRERDLEMGALSGVFPPAMAIFALKQLGWKDTQESTDVAAVIAQLDKVRAEIKSELLK